MFLIKSVMDVHLVYVIILGFIYFYLHVITCAITDALKQQHTDSLNDSHIEGYIAIPHLRDMLIAPHERHSKQNLWKRALDFLLAKESRLRSETQVVAGEEFEVLRWIQVSSLLAADVYSINSYYS